MSVGHGPRKEFRSARDKLEEAILKALKLCPDEIKDLIKTMTKLSKNKNNAVDARTQKMATEFLIKHAADIYMYEHPVEQKHNLNLSGGISVIPFEKKPVGAKVG